MNPSPTLGEILGFVTDVKKLSKATEPPEELWDYYLSPKQLAIIRQQEPFWDDGRGIFVSCRRTHDTTFRGQIFSSCCKHGSPPPLFDDAVLLGTGTGADLGSQPIGMASA